MNTIAVIASVGFAGIGAVLLVRALVDLVFALNSRKWPRTYGVITSSKVKTIDSESDLHSAIVQYRFSVGGPELTGDQVCFGAKNRGWLSGWAKDVVKRYPVGKTVSVHHDPEDPRNAVLEPGVHAILIANLLAGLVLFVLSIYMLF